MAAVTLKPYNVVSLAVNTATQLNLPPGHYYVSVLNLGPGNLFFKGDGTVLATDPASYQLPINMTFAPLIGGSIWVLADQAGKASIALLPKP